MILALAPNSDAFIAGRAITGVGCAGTFVGCFIIIAHSSKPRLRPAMTSSLSATFALASVIGPLIGGAFTQNVTWRWWQVSTKFRQFEGQANLSSFYINLPLGGVAAVSIWFAFHPPKAAAPVSASPREKFLQMDLIGVVLICAAMVCFTLATRWAGVEKAWPNSTIIGLFVGAALLIVTFVLDQSLQGERATIMPSFLKNRKLLVGAVFEFLWVENAAPQILSG